ncbi:MAG: Lsm family RNA-binding protein [Candidatus Thorarchaeota archaeon]
MSEVAAMRAFNRELASVVGATVEVKTSAGETYVGTLKGIDQNSLSIVLSDVETKKGPIPRMFIYGSSIVSFSVAEREISLEGLVKELEKAFPPGGVQYFPETGMVLVLNKIRISPEGVEGTGPLYERVKIIADKWFEDHGLD